jgi:hypothetical protein
MPRFALLRHDSPRGLHWDFFLEVGETLHTWALDEAPQDGRSVPAKALGDHRLAYLEYEGPISGERGNVSRWDEGTYDAAAWGDGQWRLAIAGHWLKGRVALERDASSPETWQFLFQSQE